LCSIFILIQMTPKSAVAPRMTGNATSRGLSLRGAVFTTGAGLGAGAGVTLECVILGRLPSGHYTVFTSTSLHHTVFTSASLDIFDLIWRENDHSFL
ncbi:MAG: hypothetical protein JWQ08_181, partial [Deinococcus sp.]|nr:hypothetical protein [Deinococcus sp.]